MRSGLIIPAVSALAAAAIVGALFFSDTVQNALADRIILQNLRAVNEELLDEKSLDAVLIGSGGPIANDDRSSPCLAVFAGKTGFLVDVGPGAWRNIGRFKLPAADLDFVLLTHFHSDHIGDLGEVAMQTWAAGRREPMIVCGPPGVEKIAAGFNQAYELDSQYRVLHHGPETMPPEAGELRAVTITPSGNESVLVYDRDGVRISAFRVDHHPVEPACGYKIEYRGRVLVVSGDASVNENLVRQAAGADLLVENVLSAALTARISRAADREGLKRLSKILTDIPEYHATPIQAAEMARRARVKMLVLTHITPPLPNWIAKRRFMAGVGRAWDGETILGRDGLHFRLAAGSDEITMNNLED